MTILVFIASYPFISGFILLLGFAMIYFILDIMGSIAKRAFNMVKVVCRGWPPPHLDAYGDFRPEPKEEDP